MSIKISVVIPVYNASKTIVSTVYSVLNQTYPVTEIIIVNDGSSDSSRSIIETNFERYLKLNHIVLINKINEGPSIARNLGVEIAKSDWIAFLDSDDQWFPDKIKNQVLFIEGNKNIVICGTATNVLKFKEKKPNFIVTYNKLLYHNYFCTSSVLISKNIFMRSNKFMKSQKYSEDYGLWLEILSYGCAGIVNKNLVYYNVGEGERLSKSSFLMTKGEITNYKRELNSKRIKSFTFITLILFSFLKLSRRFIFFSIR